MKYSRRLSWNLMSTAVMLCFLAPVTADNQTKDKAAIRSAIQKMDVAAHNKDADGYVAFTYPDFVDIDKKGLKATYGKDERCKKISRIFAQASEVTSHTTVNFINFSKQGAVVDKSSVMSITILANGQKTQMKGIGTYRDLWVKTSSGWLQKVSKTMTETTTINGHPVS